MYFFIEEKTPAGYTLKIMPSSWQFIVFDKNGNSVDIYGNSNKFTHNLPLIMFVGQKFKIQLDYYLKNYSLVKVRDGSMIIPYIVLTDREKHYVFIEANINIDLIPVRIMWVPNLSVMMKSVDSKVVPDYTIIDQSVSSSDIYIIQNRYHAKTIINVDKNIEKPVDESDDTNYVFDNLNMYSQNSLFLAAAHLRAMDFSKLNQLLFDFQLSPVDLEGILSYIDTYLKKGESGKVSTNNISMLTRLRTRANFYLQLLLNDSDEETKSMIENEDDLNMLNLFNDLVVKVTLLTTNEQNLETLNTYRVMINKRSQDINDDKNELKAAP